MSSKVAGHFALSLTMNGFPWWLDGIESTCQCRRFGLDLGVGEIPWRRKRQPTLVFLPGKSHGQRSLAGYSPWDLRELDKMTEQQHIIDLVTYLLILLILSFAEQKFLILMKSSLSIISFMDHILMMNLKKTSSYPRSSRFFPMLFYRKFIVLHLIFRSVIHFELTFVKGVVFV